MCSVRETHACVYTHATTCNLFVQTWDPVRTRQQARRAWTNLHLCVSLCVSASTWVRLDACLRTTTWKNGAHQSQSSHHTCPHHVSCGWRTTCASSRSDATKSTSPGGTSHADASCVHHVPNDVRVDDADAGGRRTSTCTPVKPDPPQRVLNRLPRSRTSTTSSRRSTSKPSTSDTYQCARTDVWTHHARASSWLRHDTCKARLASVMLTSNVVKTRPASPSSDAFSLCDLPSTLGTRHATSTYAEGSDACVEATREPSQRRARTSTTMPRSRNISSRPPWNAVGDHDVTLGGERHSRNDAPHGRIKRTSRGTAMAVDVRGRPFVRIPSKVCEKKKKNHVRPHHVTHHPNERERG